MSFKNLFIHFVARFMFWKASQASLGLEKAGLDSGFSPAACLPGRGGGNAFSPTHPMKSTVIK